MGPSHDASVGARLPQTSASTFQCCELFKTLIKIKLLDFAVAGDMLSVKFVGRPCHEFADPAMNTSRVAPLVSSVEGQEGAGFLYIGDETSGGSTVRASRPDEPPRRSF